MSPVTTAASAGVSIRTFTSRAGMRVANASVSPVKMSDLTPLPKWRQRSAALVAWWRKTRDARRRAFKSFRTGVGKLLTLAVSVVGATLISFGVWTIYASAGYITGGLMCWLLLWSYEKDRGGQA